MSNSVKTLVVLCGLLISAIVASSLEASLITGTSASASSSYTSLGRTPDKTVGGIGLTGDAHSTAASEMWLTGEGGYVAGTTWFKLDLGGAGDSDATYDVGQMKVWNYNESGSNTNRGIQLADIYVSPTGAGAPGTGDWVLVLEDQLFDEATGLATYDDPTVVTLNQTTAHVGFIVVSNYNTPFSAGNNYAGLSEVQFFTAVPEPSVISIATIAMCCLGRVLRRRNKTLKNIVAN